jgi:tRNA threonylcarbamoyladenosine biosynthesis protein TsaB
VTLFALDTSTRAGSMALWRDGAVSAVTLEDLRSHAERQPDEAVVWLAAQGLALADVTAFVVVSGPGSFTGLRVGVAAVQGWAAALGRPVHAVPTLAAVLRASRLDATDGALVVPAVDGHRAEVFYALADPGAAGQERWRLPATVGSAPEAIAHVAPLASGRPILVTGNAADHYGAVFRAAGWAIVAPAMPLAAAAVHLAAEGEIASAGPGDIRLEYVRRTDAEVNRERQAARRT